MSLTIPDDVLESAHMSEQELLKELAVMLFTQERLTLAQAARLAKVNRLQFQHLLASRNIALHYDITDFEEDISTLKQSGRL